MTATNNITTSTLNMNIYNNTEQTINSSNVYIPTKVCSICSTIKYITEFNKRKTSRDGYQNQCKNCIDNRRKEHFELITDEINQHDINNNKTCNKCNQIKNITEYYKQNGNHDGYYNLCKNCHNNLKKNTIMRIRTKYCNIIKNIVNN